MTRLNSESQPLLEVLAQRQATLAAMDTSIRIYCREVNAAAAGTVKAWAGRYGQRGDLKEFVLKSIQEAAPLPVRSPGVLLNLVAHYGIFVATPRDRAVLRASLKNTFRRLQHKGLIEPLHTQKRHPAPGIWRLKSPATLVDLVAQATAAQEAPTDGRPDTVTGTG